MTAFNNRINNQVLNKLMLLIKKQLNNPNKTIRIKIHEVDNVITLQTKHTVTRQVARFSIFINPENEVKAILFLRNRNPNTVQYFDNFFTVTEVYEIVTEKDIEDSVIVALDFLETDSEFIKVPFNKIKVCKKESELNGDNILMRVIKSIDTHDDYVRINFDKTELFFAYDNNSSYNGIRKPVPGDFFFTDNKNKFQTYSPTRANHHFELN